MFSKPCLVNLISKDTHLVFSILIVSSQRHTQIIIICISLLDETKKCTHNSQTVRAKLPVEPKAQAAGSNIIIKVYGKCFNVLTQVACQKGIYRQTVQTQIRLLLKKQPHQGLPCLLIQTSILRLPVLITNI